MTLAVQSRRPVNELTDQQRVEEWRRLSRRSVEDMQRDLLAEAARHAQSSEGFAR